MTRLLLAALALAQACTLARPIAGLAAYLRARGTLDQQRAAVMAALEAR